jgi:hypothetical protein
MECAYSYQIDPKDYPFKNQCEERKRLDTDELRHLIQPTVHVIAQDFKGEEHKFCDKEQLCPLGKFRRPKILVEAEQRGFATGLEMVEADKASQKKAEEDKKQKEIEAQQKEIDELKEIVRQLIVRVEKKA